MNKMFTINLRMREILLVLFCCLPISIMIGKAALNTNLVIFDLFAMAYFFKDKKFELISSNKNLFFAFFLILFVSFNIFFSTNLELSFQGLLGLIKNIIFCLGLTLFVSPNDIKKFFSPIVFISLMFVSLHIYLQYFTGFDIFGNSLVGQNRSTAVFGNQIPGSYILKFFFIGLLLSTFNKNIFLNLTYLSFFTTAIILSNERMPILNIIFFSILFISIFPQINYKKKLLCLFSYLSICFLIYNVPIPSANNSELTKQEKLYENLLLRTKTQLKRQTVGKNISNLYWFQHFRAAAELFLDSPIIGSGIKSYRYSCPLKQLEKKKIAQLSCNIHPHNIYFEIISETGILGLFIVSFILFRLFLLSIGSYRRDSLNRRQLMIVILPIFMLFNPIQFTGSFFSTYSGFFFFLNLGIAFNFIRNYSNIK